MNFFSSDKPAGKETREDRRCQRCDAQPGWSARYSIRVPEGVSACSNASAANAPGAIKAGPARACANKHRCQAAVRASSDRNGGRVQAF